MKDIRAREQYQSQNQLEREKENNKLRMNQSKNDIEREKINAQKEIANKQLEIARTNKNKYDFKPSDNKKK